MRAQLDKLPQDLRTILEDELGRREFVPLIENIVRVADDTDPSEWEVETDRGTTVFLLDSEDDVRRLGPFRALFIDTHGIRYIIPDTRKLNAHSRRIMARYFQEKVQTPFYSMGNATQGGRYSAVAR